MKKLLMIFVSILFVLDSLYGAEEKKLTAPVGGTLIDGFGRPPIRNSVILLEGERIKAVGTVDSLAIPPGTEVISTEGMSVLTAQGKHCSPR